MLVAHPSGEVSEDERLGGEGSRAHLLEVLLGLLEGKVPVALLVGERHQPVGVDPLALMQPQLRQLHGLSHLLGPGHEHPLEDTRHVPYVELVVEVGGRLPEAAAHAPVQHEGRLHDLLALLGHVGSEAAQVAAEEGRVDRAEALGRRESHGEGGEEPLQPRVDREGAGGGVHRREVVCVEEDLLAQLA